MSSYSYQFTRSVPAETNAQLTVTNTIKQKYLSPNFQLSDDLLAQFDRGYDMGDELCDAFLADAKADPKRGMPLFKQALEHGIDSVEDAPESLKALFAQADQVPDWYDPEVSRVASRALERYPLQQGLMLQSVALMGGYSVPGLVQPLLETGALESSVVARMGRTLAFTAAVTLPDGIQYADVGYKQALHVRVVHGLVRARLRASEEWDYQRFGVAINQTDMVATNLQFSLIVIHGLSTLKCHLSAEERLAILSLWRYIGYLMGIDPSLMPVTEDECNEWLYSYLVTQKMDAANARGLAQALNEIPILLDSDTKKARFEQKLRAGITRLYWGDEIGDDLGLPNPSWGKTCLSSLAAAQNGADYLRSYLSPVEHVLTSIATRYRQHIKGQYLAAKPELAVMFDPIEEAYNRNTERLAS